MLAYERMRLAFLGPADGDRDALREVAQLVFERLDPDRIMYIGVDDVFDTAIEQWASEIVMGDPSDSALWDRAVRACAVSDHPSIDSFLRRERQRERLRRITCLPNAHARTVELLSGVVALIIHDVAMLDDEDVVPAELVVFGKAVEPMIKKMGQRVFISPGPLGHLRGGVLLLEEEQGGELVASVLDSNGGQVRREVVVVGSQQSLPQVLVRDASLDNVQGTRR